MKAAMTNGVLRIDDSAIVNGQRLPISPFRAIIVSTWLGTMTTVPSQSRSRDRKPKAAEITATIGRPIVQ